MKIAEVLETQPYGDPELLIRTSGEYRVSNFMLWQVSYAEIYVTDILWPDFRPKHLYEAVLNYQQRERRLGGL
jgi:undecaprenyl diphosphate synthase